MKELFEKQTALKSEVEGLREKADKTTDDYKALKTKSEELIAVSSQIDADMTAKAALGSVKTAPATGVSTHPGAEVVKTESGFMEEDYDGLKSEDVKYLKSVDAVRAFDAFARAKGSERAIAAMIGQDAYNRHKGLSESIDSEGGFLAPIEHQDRILQRRPAPMRLAQRVTNIGIKGRSTEYPVSIYSASDKDRYANAMRTVNVGEVASSSSQADVTEPVFGDVAITVFTRLATVRPSNDLIEDMANFGGWLMGELDESSDQQVENEIVNGLGGNAGSLGLITSIGQTYGIEAVNSTVNDSFGFADINGLPFKVDEQYLDGNAGFIMNRVSGGATAFGLVDSQGRPIFTRGGLMSGSLELAPDTLVGYPVIYSSHMPNIGNATNPVIFGDLRGYVLARRGIKSVTVDEKSLAEFNKTKFVLKHRYGGTVAEPWRMRALTCI